MAKRNSALLAAYGHFNLTILSVLSKGFSFSKFIPQHNFVTSDFAEMTQHVHCTERLFLLHFGMGGRPTEHKIYDRSIPQISLRIDFHRQLERECRCQRKSLFQHFHRISHNLDISYLCCKNPAKNYQRDR